MHDTRVVITVILSGTLVVLAFILAIVVLSIRGADAATLLSLIATLVSVYNLYLLRDTRTSVGQIQTQTNGQLSKLTDAVIAAPAPPEPAIKDGAHV
jgi:hypothetical protein